MIRFLLTCFACCLAPALSAAEPIQEVKAQNGTTAWLIEDHSLPVVTVRVAFENSGAAYDLKGKEGLASFAMQMFDEGAGDMDALTFGHAVEDHAIRLSAEAQEDSSIVGVQTLSQFKDEALRLFSLALTQPRFDTAALERTRASIISDIKQLEENPAYLASLHWKAHAFANHPYAHPRRGTLTSVAAITQADLKTFSQTLMACSQKRIAIVGDITAEQVRQWLNTTFAAAHCATPVAAVTDVTITRQPSAITVSHSVPQTVVEAGLPGVGYHDPRYYAAIVLNHILGGDSMTSRLGKAIRDKRGLAYVVQTSLEQLDHAPLIIAQFATRGPHAKEALSIFMDELKTISHNGVSETELRDAKSYLTGSFPLQMDNQGDLAEMLLVIQHEGLGQDYLGRRNVLMNAVTQKQVNDAATSLLSGQPLIVMVGEPQP